MIRLSAAEARQFESYAKKESRKAKPKCKFIEPIAVAYNLKLTPAIRTIVKRENGTVIEKYRRKV